MSDLAAIERRLERLEEVERRLQRLEDIEAIRNLKERYATLCDQDFDPDGIAELHGGLHLPSRTAWATTTGARRSGSSCRP
ncbi:MAG: hypothetical protein R3C15_18695 [Thermoleophilia bacterium]